MLIGCPGPNREGRSCEGLSFDHPGALVWADYDEGDRLAFVGPNASIDYLVVQIEEPIPDGAIGFVGQEDVPCTVERRIVLSEETSGLELELELRQDERVSQLPNEETLTIDFNASVPTENVSTGLGLLWIRPFSFNESAGGDQEIVEDLELDGGRYGLSVVFPEVDSINELYLSRPDRIEAFTFSEGIGLSVLERPDVGPLHLDEVIRADPDR